MEFNFLRHAGDRQGLVSGICFTYNGEDVHIVLSESQSKLENYGQTFEAVGRS